MQQLIEKLSGIDQVRELISSRPDQDAITFLTRAAEHFRVESIVYNENNATLQSTVFFSTHHTGAIDLISTFPAIAKIAPRLKIIANKEVMALSPLREHFIPVNTISTGEKNQEARKEIETHLASGGNILVYPAGKVGTLSKGKPCDFPWRTGIAKIAKDYAEFVVPVHVDAKNPYFYYLARRLSPKLSLAFIFSALTWRRDSSPVKVRIGRAINRAEFTALTPDQLTNRVRENAYSLAKDTL